MIIYFGNTGKTLVAEVLCARIDIGFAKAKQRQENTTANNEFNLVLKTLLLG